MTPRDDAQWLPALKGSGGQQVEALTDLRTYVLRAALFTLQRALRYVGHLESSTLAQIAEDCAQEALTTTVQHLDDFRGASKFTTWAYAFAVDIALATARRERPGSIPLDGLPEGSEARSPVHGEDGSPDPERRALQREMLAAIRDGIEQHLTVRQQEAVRALVFEEIPVDEIVRRWGSTRSAVYKVVHDARRKLKTHLARRGFDLEEVFELFAVGG